ncbi:MAG: iron-sulfur cluster assembly protein [Acidimicrobiales bacterium]
MAQVTEAEVVVALSGVIDPELDEPLVQLGFITGVRVDGERVEVDLRLPTYWCSPNFTWLMAADVRTAVLGLPGVRQARVRVHDHHAAAEITAGVNAGRSFGEVFGADADADLDDLRLAFRRKAFQVRLGRLLADWRPRPARPTLADLPDTPLARSYLDIRRELVLDCGPGAPVVTEPDGREVTDVERFARRARAIRISLEGNSALCTTLFDTRYGTEMRHESRPLP